MSRYKILSTKKLDPSLIEKAKKNNIEIREQEAIRVKPITGVEKREEVLRIVKGGNEFVVFTSSNAVSALAGYIADYEDSQQIQWNIFCLEGKTKEAIEQGALPGRIISTAAHSTELSTKIIEAGINEVVFFCGDKRRDELPLLLKNAGVKVDEVLLYQTIETPVKETEEYDGVLFFSPSAVQSFFSCNQLSEPTVCFAVGETTAGSIRSSTGNRIIISSSASQEKMLDAVIEYFQKSIVEKRNGE